MHIINLFRSQCVAMCRLMLLINLRIINDGKIIKTTKYINYMFAWKTR